MLFGPPGSGRTHLAIGLGRAVVEAGHSVLFTTAMNLITSLSKAETEGQLHDKLAFYAKPKLLIIDELGYLAIREALGSLVLPARFSTLRARQPG